MNGGETDWVKGFLLYNFFTYMRGKRPHHHESLSFTKVHAIKVGFQVVAILVITFSSCCLAS